MTFLCRSDYHIPELTEVELPSDPLITETLNVVPMTQVPTLLPQANIMSTGPILYTEVPSNKKVKEERYSHFSKQHVKDVGRKVLNQLPKALPKQMNRIGNALQINATNKSKETDNTLRKLEEITLPSSDYVTRVSVTPEVMRSVNENFRMSTHKQWKRNTPSPVNVAQRKRKILEKRQESKT